MTCYDIYYEISESVGDKLVSFLSGVALLVGLVFGGICWFLDRALAQMQQEGS